ncbi:MAG: type II secretion system protein [Verrucomicrobiia bacterium]|jgi:type II secretory pathway pseudopilin PulG
MNSISNNSGADSVEGLRCNTSKDTAFNLIELLVLVAIVVILAILLQPVMTKARANAQAASCANQLRQWGLAFQMYSQDYHGWLFTTKHWASTEFTENGSKVRNPYAHYLGNATSDKIVQLRNCPEVLKSSSVQQLKADKRYSYSINWPNVKNSGLYVRAPADSYGGASYRLDEIPKPAEFLLLIDSDGSSYRVRAGNLKEKVSSILGRHVGGVNILRADQHVDFVGFDVISTQSTLPDDQNSWFQAN